MSLDLKTHRALRPMLGAIRESEMEKHVVISGCHPRCVQRIRELVPQLTVLLNHDGRLRLKARAWARKPWA